MHARHFLSILLASSISALGACSGDDDAPPPSQKPLTPVKAGSGGKGGKGGSGGASGKGGSQGGDGGSSGGNGGSTGSGNAGGLGGAGSAGAPAGAAGAGGSAGAGASGAAGSAGAPGGMSGGGGDGGSAGGPGPCAAQGDCKGPDQNPICNPKTGFCVECLASADCGKDPDKKICELDSGYCVECLEEADCDGHPNGPHCDLARNACTCKSNAECASSPKGPLCDVKGLQRCGECITAFDCKNAQKPGCTLDDQCFKGDFCSGDDPEEAGDDGPLGATDVTPEVLDPPDFFPPWKRTVENRHICDLPIDEADWYKFQVEARDSYEIEVDWADGEADLDLVVIDSASRVWGYSYFGRPARVKLTYLPAGTLYAYVYRSSSFDKLSATTTPYTLRITRDPEAGKCLSGAQCAAEYSNQVLRGVCEPLSGVCTFIDGNGNLGEGASCDDDDDCKSGQCSYEPFTEGAHARSFCTRPCNPAQPCPDNQRCADYLVPAICLPACSNSEQCHASLSEEPPQGQSWKHLSCNAQTGACE